MAKSTPKAQSKVPGKAVKPAAAKTKGKPAPAAPKAVAKKPPAKPASKVIAKKPVTKKAAVAKAPVKKVVAPPPAAKAKASVAKAPAPKAKASKKTAPVVAKAAPVATADPVNADEAYLNELVTIIIPKDDRENDIVAVGHNGRNIRINRGEISKIPRKYLNVLKDAVKTVYAQTEKDGLGKATQVPMYPYQVIQG